MLPGNIETKIRQIIEAKGNKSWIRINVAAKEYSKDNPSERTKFFRWRKKVEKGRVDGFKVQILPGNVSFIGLSNADPEVLNEFISEDKKASRNVKTGIGFLAWLNQRNERKRLEQIESAVEWERGTNKLKVRTKVHDEIKQIKRDRKKQGKDAIVSVDEQAVIEKKWTEFHEDQLKKQYNIR
jgi:hypothetical protein